MRDVERQTIEICGGNISLADKKLGVFGSAIYKMMAMWN
jgi:hypothetical protein